jgi:opacity protein-like surface antigen
MRDLIIACALLAIATPAAAQSTYIGGAVVFDLARFDKVGYDEDDLPRITTTGTSIDGEAIGFNLRIGRALGERWGVEFEFARSGQLENHEAYGLPFLTDVGTRLPELADLTIPAFQYELESEQRYTSYGALAWVRQNLGERVDLTYLAGVVFNRAEIEQDLRVIDTRLVQWISVIPNLTVIEYSIAPAVGVDAGFRLSDPAAITAGLRLHGAAVGGRTGLLLRPNVGVRWTF